MQNTTKHIDKFISHFDERIKNVASLEATDFVADFRKTLYVAIMDGMSKSVFPWSTNRERFVSFIEKFANWPDGSNLSLPHLVRLLSLVPDPQFEEVRKFARSQLSNWNPGTVIFLNSDTNLDQILSVWPTGQESMKVLHGVRLNSMQHFNLLYTYRNSLVHEFRTLGFPFEDQHEKEPFYIHLTRNVDNLSIIEYVWQLNYPEEFFRSICQRSLEALRSYLYSNMIDPIDFYSEGSYFLEELNK